VDREEAGSTRVETEDQTLPAELVREAVVLEVLRDITTTVEVEVEAVVQGVVQVEQDSLYRKALRLQV
jgi:hypothetical protein